ncbi:DUF3857 domain-containing protein [Urechidicola croceus]|uniref:DUF3857 domain-containing protein n=1 Tax=Urechidicola croceus TaxID=1850246 RepID=A0A1D8P7M4_9FLAO|nr:DUF3857 domain-containing protein [Urechidicola croceus]AOW20552.1 hypothetical protein LPB138_07610 [Urechidicola croceus]
MIKKIPNLILLLLFIFSNPLHSQNIELSTLLIPKELTENANSVVRFDNMEIDMVSQNEMVIKVQTAVSVLNELGDRYADITLNYDKRMLIKSVKGYIYNSFGKEIEKIKKSDFDDYSASDGFSLFSDGRLIHYDYTPTSYPYTIYYEYELKTSNTAFIPRWMPISTYYQGVQKSSYTFKYPTDIKINKLEKQFEGYDVKSNNNGTELIYEVANIPAIEYESYAPSLIDLVPNLIVGVNKFNLEGVNGEASNWLEFGKWYYDNLLQSTQDLPEKTKQEIRNLTKGAVSNEEKAKIVYEYVQDKVRYISIQVGIGGFKPMLASEVDNLSYGDCKALTNYTKALLDAVDVPSNYTVLWAGNEKRSVENEFLSVQGNHVILNLPTEEGDLWLECTSQKVPFSELGDFTDDRDVLVITPEGGEIKHTRVYNDNENTQKIVGKYTLNDNGAITAKVNMVSKGTQFDNHLHYESKTEKELDKSYKEFWDNINNMAINTIDINNNKSEGQFEEVVEFSAENYGVISGERMIFPVNAFNVMERAPKRMRNRKLPVEISRGFYDVDEVEVELPSNYSIEAIANNVNIESKYGTYKLTIEKVGENTLKYSRKFLLKNGKYSKESYNEYRDFWKSVVKSDNSKVVLLKK